MAEKLCVSNSYQTPKIEKIILSASVSFKPQQVRGLAASSKSNSNLGRLATTNKRTKGKSMKGLHYTEQMGWEQIESDHWPRATSMGMNP